MVLIRRVAERLSSLLHLLRSLRGPFSCNHFNAGGHIYDLFVITLGVGDHHLWGGCLIISSRVYQYLACIQTALTYLCKTPSVLGPLGVDHALI